jgi:AraC family transcriptional regulator
MFVARTDQTQFAPKEPQVQLAAIPTPALQAEKTDAPVPWARIRGGLAPRTLRRVREYIEANLEDRISIASLASVAGLSTFHFARAFKQSQGVAPHDYLVQRRVKRAMELLDSTELSISEIACAAGFADQSHCTRRFQQHVGMSPRDYRWSMP